MENILFDRSNIIEFERKNVESARARDVRELIDRYYGRIEIRCVFFFSIGEIYS